MTPPVFDAEPWDYLGADEAIDVEHPLVQSIASELRTGDDVTLARLAFDRVRDGIAEHTNASRRASEVLDREAGDRHGRIHALVALLRAGGVQAGVSYFDERVVAAALVDDRWVLLDPTKGVEFSAEENRLSFPLPEGTHPVIHARPA